jgi:hypothetical protein
MQLTENFYKIEFDCRDNTPMPESVLDNIKELAKNLQTIRNLLNEPIHINSGYRSKEYNKKIGGAKNSQHIIGYAADITRTYDFNPQGEFVHYDIRGYKARWNYSTKYKDFY